MQLLPPIPISTITQPTTHSRCRVRKRGQPKKTATSRPKKKKKDKDKLPVWTSSKNCISNNYPSFISSSPIGPTVLLPLDSSPLELFHQVFPSQLLDNIVNQTNPYAHQKKVGNWVDTTPVKMNAFIGFVLATAIHQLPQLENYWSSHWVLRVPDFAKIFTRNRFWMLWANLHLNDNTKALSRDDPHFDRLFKIRPMLDILQQTFRKAHNPSQQISVIG